MSCTHSWAPHPMLCVALLRQECSLQPPARGKFKASACRQLLPSPKSNYKTVAEGKKLDELFSCVCNAGNFSEMLKLLLLLSLCSETRRRSRNKNGQNILLFRVPSAKTISRRWQTDRHFYLTSEKIRCQGEENDRKVFESSSPAKYKSSCTEDDQKSTKFI